ncbi:MAG: PHP domain-containing protein [Pseudomonadota bacterium]|nr:PHP domain-containing protein [Pseudomonadota bacterium]
MTEATDRILEMPVGASFHRADLHIHSHGASHDVRDGKMTPNAIVATAAKEGLSVIAITDHNEIDNVEPAIKAAAGSGVVVIPGVELSTSQGHLLCYLPTLQALQKYHGQLNVVDRGKQTSRCQQSILECLNLLSPLGGFAILAHVDIATGFETENPGNSPHKRDVLSHPALLGIELKRADSVISYGPSDPDADRVQCGRDRIKKLGLGANQNLARVLNSDAHTLDTLGKNAENAKRVTRYKMDTPSFDALCIALEDADARVRIEDQIPETIPVILGVCLDGGFLAGQIIQFSPNLNCIIGGRGTGKSLTFESVRCLAEDASDSKIIDSEVWPDEILLVWKDQVGEMHTLRRLKDGELENTDDPDFGPCTFEIDCFGQGEAAKISMEAQSDPLALLHYLDKFVDLTEAQEHEEASREQLLTFQTEIEGAEENVRQIPEYERMLATTRQQLAALKKPEVKELIELQQKIASERELRTQITVKLQDAKKGASQVAKSAATEIRELADPDALAVGAAEFKAITAAAVDFEDAVATAETTLRISLSGFETIVTAQIANWRAKEGESQKKIDEKRRELEAARVPFDMSYITKLTTDEAKHAQNVKNLNSWKPHLLKLKKQRAEALKERWAARERVATIRDAFGRQASDTLREALSDLQVSLKYQRNAHSPGAADLIIETMGWKTNQQPRAAYLVGELTVPFLLDAITRNDTAPITKLKTPEGVVVFKRDEAQAIIDRLKETAIKCALERMELHDLPKLVVTRELPDGSGGKKFVQREFSRLSLGQQQSVLLALILSANSNRPLIIDQPEDNLDGEFIYSTLVPVLRQAKERRQVIIVTHNPNVAVLGDAEQIVVMKAMHNNGQIVSRGSIDNQQTCDAACAILEGHREAFLRRAKMYGIKLR